MPLRKKLLDLRHRALEALAAHSSDANTDTGLLALVADAQLALQALEEEPNP